MRDTEWGPCGVWSREVWAHPHPNVPTYPAADIVLLRFLAPVIQVASRKSCFGFFSLNYYYKHTIYGVYRPEIVAPSATYYLFGISLSRFSIADACVCMLQQPKKTYVLEIKLSAILCSFSYCGRTAVESIIICPAGRVIDWPMDFLFEPWSGRFEGNMSATTQSKQ